MKKQTQEQFLETIDRLLEKLADREAEIAALRLAIRKMGDCDCGLTNSNNRKHIKTCNFMVAEQALSTQTSTSYLEQWGKDRYGEPVSIKEPDYHYEAMGCGLEDRNITDRYDAMRHGWDCAVERIFEQIPDGTLYARKEPK